jgi:hypothetical protein
MGTSPNPFYIHGVAHDEFFTDRADEVARIVATLRDPGAKLVVYGLRRMGKTSALVRAVDRARETGTVPIMADLSTASSVVDMGNRIMEAASKALGKRWADLASEFVQRIKATLSLAPDVNTGLIVPSFELGLRSAPIEAQRDGLGRVLDTMDALARERDTPIGIVLDEFQELHRFGGESAEWHMRGIIQRHQHVSYVLAGSQPQLIQLMLGEGRALYGLLDVLHFGPMDPGHLATWIDDRLRSHGVAAEDVGREVVALAGPRTRDIVQLARKVWDLRHADGSADPGDAHIALTELVIDQEDLLRALWDDCTPHQQDVLRAVAHDRDGLTTSDSIRRFALRSSGTATNSARALMDAGRLVRAPTRTGYGFDSPFLREWVRTTTLGDLGMQLFPGGS